MTKQSDLLALLLLSGAALLMLAPLWSSGIPNPGDLLTGNPGDFLMSIHRTYELASAWENGIFYPRFGLNLNFGYGAPLFQYYPPLASYLGLLFLHFGMGFVAATKAVTSMSLLLAAWGAYFYTRDLLQHRLAASVAAFVYLLSPYLLFVIYERGAVSESLTWALLPWLVWAAHRYTMSSQRSAGLATAALVALMMLGHNATALFVTPLVALYVVVLSLSRRDWWALSRVAAAMLLGLGLSVFYWAPALLEMNLTKSSDFLFSGGTGVEANVKRPDALIQTSPVALYAGAERFRVAAWQVLAGGVGVLGLIVAWRRRPRMLWFWTGVLLCVLLLQLEASLPFWQQVPFVRYIQFPWRLYGLIAFSVAVLFGALFADAGAAAVRTAWRPRLVAAGALALLAWFSLANLRIEQLPNWVALEEAGVNQVAMWTRGQYGHPLFSDYTLRTLQIDNRVLAASRPTDDPLRLPPIAAPARLEVRAENPVRYVLDVQAAQPWTLRLHRPAFPGWQVTVDGASAAVTPAGAAGLVSAELPAGAYRVVASFGDSMIRRIANLISIAALAVWLVWWLPGRCWRWKGLLTGLLVILLAAYSSWLQTEGRLARYPLSTSAQFADGIRLAGVDVPRTTFCPNDIAAVRLYWFTERTPAVDYKLFVHIVTPDESRKAAQGDNMPFAGFNPMTRWEPGELVDFVQEVALEATPPGKYMVVLGLYDPATMENLSLIASEFGLPGDRVRLGEIEVVDCNS